MDSAAVQGGPTHPKAAPPTPLLTQYARIACSCVHRSTGTPDSSWKPLHGVREHRQGAAAVEFVRI